MKKTFFILLLVFSVLVLSTTASEALQPGIDNAIWKMQKNFADALRVRDKSYSKQLTKRTDSVLALSCFGQSLRLTGSLGIIFSDRVPINFTLPSLAFTLPRLSASLTCNIGPPPTITPVITLTGFTLAFANRGLTDLLSRDLGSVLSGVLAQMLNNFLGALTNVLGGLVSGWLLDNFSALIALLPSMPSNSIFGIFIPNIPCVPSIQDAIAALLRSLMGMLFPPCNMTAQLWTGTPGTSITGIGIENGTPYTNMLDILGVPPGMGVDFMKELNTVTDTNVRTNALNDFLSNLLAPGNIPSWKVAPTFVVGTNTATVISQM